MTLPSTNIYPIKQTFENIQDVDGYLSELVFSLCDRDNQIADECNGVFLNSSFEKYKWVPILKGTTNAGTFTYTAQYGSAFRQSIMTDVWFDVSWTANVGSTGNLYLELPYKVKTNDGMPFVGALQTSTIAYGAGQTILTINAIPGTTSGEIWSSGSGNATANIGIAAAGRLIGHIRYIGVETP